MPAAFTCLTCNSKFATAEFLVQHNQTRTHLAMAKSRSADPAAPTAVQQQPQPIAKQQPVAQPAATAVYSHHCTLCDMHTSSENATRMHEFSVAHQVKLGKEWIPNGPHTCYDCLLSFPTVQVLASHQTSSKHLSKVQPVVAQPASVKPVVAQPPKPAVSQPAKPAISKPAKPVVSQPAKPVAAKPVVSQPAKPVAAKPVPSKPVTSQPMTTAQPMTAQAVPTGKGKRCSTCHCKVGNAEQMRLHNKSAEHASTLAGLVEQANQAFESLDVINDWLVGLGLQPSPEDRATALQRLSTVHINVFDLIEGRFSRRKRSSYALVIHTLHAHLWFPRKKATHPDLLAFLGQKPEKLTAD